MNQNCGSEDHIAKECDQPRNTATIQCRNCDQMGHTYVVPSSIFCLDTMRFLLTQFLPIAEKNALLQRIGPESNAQTVNRWAMASSDARNLSRRRTGSVAETTLASAVARMLALAVVTTVSARTLALVELSGRRLLLLQSLPAAGNPSAPMRHSRPLQYGCVAIYMEMVGFCLPHCVHIDIWAGSKDMRVRR